MGKPVKKEAIEQLLELANLAPTAKSLQNRNFIIVTDKKIKEKIYEAGFRQKQLREAPVIIALTTDFNKFEPKAFLQKCRDWGMSVFGATPENFTDNPNFNQNWRIWTQLWPIQDVDAAITTLMLAATNKGLSTCWIGLFNHKKVEKILKLPENQRVVSLVCLGYPKGLPKPQERKPIEELIHWQKW